jgi:hypothetical protein
MRNALIEGLGAETTHWIGRRIQIERYFVEKAAVKAQWQKRVQVLDVTDEAISELDEDEALEAVAEYTFGSAREGRWRR